MNNIQSTTHVLAVNDLKISTDYYLEKLGLEIVSQYPGWTIVNRGALTIMLGECPDAIPASDTGDHSYFAYVNVSDAQTLFDEYKDKGVQFIKTIADEPWGMREFGLRTIDGHRIMFGQSISY